MSRRIGWRLRRKNRIALKFTSLIEEKPLKPKRENKYLEARREAAEKYIRHLEFLR